MPLPAAFLGGLLAATLAALPAPPDAVVLKARNGDVTLDHKAHLARRTACKACHGPGQVGKMPDLEQQRAHLICVGCHRQVEQGPTRCSACHRQEP